MPSKKLGSAPTFDEMTFAKRLHERVLTTGGKQFAVFQERYFPTWVRWVRGTGEFDGSGVRDVVNANAIYLDDVKGDLDNFRENQGVAHNSINARLAALEAAVGDPPFPG